MSQSNPKNSAALERQMAHEQAHNDRKYDGKGKRKKDTLPPHHLKGQRLLPQQVPDWLHT